MKTEVVFKIGGEGGGISISRQESEVGETFIYHHREFDPTGEGLQVKVDDVLATFELAFRQINNRYPWYMLYIVTVHVDFKAYIIEKLIEKLNGESVSPEVFNSRKDGLERILGIEIRFGNNLENEPCWGCKS